MRGLTAIGLMTVSRFPKGCRYLSDRICYVEKWRITCFAGWDISKYYPILGANGLAGFYRYLPEKSFVNPVCKLPDIGYRFCKRFLLLQLTADGLVAVGCFFKSRTRY